MEKISLGEKFGKFSKHERPQIVAQRNGQNVKLVKVQGVLPWHHHEDIKDMFLVWRGRFRVKFRDRVIKREPGGVRGGPSRGASSARPPTKRPKSSALNLPSSGTRTTSYPPRSRRPRGAAFEQGKYLNFNV